MKAVFLIFAVLIAVEIKAAEFNVKQFGAVGNGSALDTTALQAAIDAAKKTGGGIVSLPPGIYLCGTLRLKSDVTLQLQKGAILLGSTEAKDYRNGALIIAEKECHIGICGDGAIDGQGAELCAKLGRQNPTGQRGIDGSYRGNGRPFLIRLASCTNVTVRGITLKASPAWVQEYRDCVRLTLERVTVRSTAAWNNDGMDLNGCQDVVVRDCDVDADDDGICLKSEGAAVNACDRVLIENCRVRSSASALKFGTGSRVGFKNITVRNLDIHDTARSAIAIESVDGALIENVNISHVRATNTGNAIFIRIGHRNTNAPVGTLRNVLISDVVVEVPAGQPDLKYPFSCPPDLRTPHNLIPSSIVGLPGHPVQNVTLRDVTIVYAGGGTRERGQVALDKVPEVPRRYPEFTQFGELPAWGFYIRHAEGVSFSNCTFRCVSPDFRSAVVADDVKKLELVACHLPPAGDEPVVTLNQVESATFQSCLPPPNPKSFLKTTGNCSEITTQP